MQTKTLTLFNVIPFFPPTWPHLMLIPLKVTEKVRVSFNPALNHVYYHLDKWYKLRTEVNLNDHFIIQYKGQKGKFPASFFSSQAPVAQTKKYMNSRDVMEFFMLKPGEYLIVPSTFNANETASFILTIMSKSENDG